MLEHIRLAKAEEIEAIRKTSDFTPVCQVLAMDQNAGAPDLAVVKNLVELDPVYFGPKTSNRQKANFVFALEERMAGAGIEVYYSNVRADDVEWQRVLKTWGCECISPSPEMRFRRSLK